MDKIDKGLGWFDKALSIVEKYKFKTVFKAVIYILIIAATIGFISNPTWIFKQYKAWLDDQHETEMVTREEIDTRIHSVVEKLNYKTNSARVMILEYHNGTENVTGLPFRKCSATYEAVNVGVMPIAREYSEINLSLLPFANYMASEGYWRGDIDSMEEIDRSFCYMLKQHGIEHFSAVTIEGIHEPLALLIVAYDQRYTNHECEAVRDNIRHCALELALMLELNQRYLMQIKKSEKEIKQEKT